jgi:hypothetical protein
VAGDVEVEAVLWLQVEAVAVAGVAASLQAGAGAASGLQVGAGRLSAAVPGSCAAGICTAMHAPTCNPVALAVERLANTTPASTLLAPC